MPAWVSFVLGVVLAATVVLVVSRRRHARLRSGEPERAAASREEPGVASLRAAFAASQDAAAVGSLTESFAHGANNRLTVILSCLDVLASAPLPDADSRHAVELASGAARQLADDVGALLAGIRRQAAEPRLVELAQSLAGAQQVFAQLPGPVVTVRSAVVPGLLVLTDAARFEAALVRVLSFARRRGAREVVCTAATFVVEERTAERPMLRKGSYHRLEFALAGASLTWGQSRGSPDAGLALGRLRDPDGLELAAVESFVARLRGQFVIDTDAASTPRLQLCLPAAEPG